MLIQFHKRLKGLNWYSKNPSAEPGPVSLDYRRVYILPTVYGLTFSGILAAMLFGSTNYNNSMGFLLTFLLSGLGLVSILYTHRNLLRLGIEPGKVLPVFAGDSLKFPVCLNARQYDRIMLALARDKQDPLLVSIRANTTECVALSVPVAKRGRVALGQFTVSTSFPLGLFRAWAKLDLAMSGMVYPRPEEGLVPFPEADLNAAIGTRGGVGNEDFDGFRTYHPGDAPRHIAWKALARGQGLLVKRFSGQAETNVWLDWDTLPNLGTEARIARLARWMLDAEQRGTSYGLRIPNTVIEPGLGELHKHVCLTALALFPAYEGTAVH